MYIKTSKSKKMYYRLNENCDAEKQACLDKCATKWEGNEEKLGLCDTMCKTVRYAKCIKKMGGSTETSNGNGESNGNEESY